MFSTKSPAHWVTFEEEGTNPQSFVHSSSDISPCLVRSCTPSSVPRPSGLKLPLNSLESCGFVSVFESSSVSVCSTPLQQLDFEDQKQNFCSTQPCDHLLQQPSHVNPCWNSSERKRGSWSSDSDSEDNVPRFFIRSEDGSKPPSDQFWLTDPHLCRKVELLSVKDSAQQEPRGREECSWASVGPKNSESSFIPKSLMLGSQQHGWHLLLRIPERKSMMCSRQWGPVYLRLLPGALMQLFYERGLERPFRELQLSTHCSISGPSLERRSPGPGLFTLKLEQRWFFERKRLQRRPSLVHEARSEQLLKLGCSDAGSLLELVRALEDEFLSLKAPRTYLKRYQLPELSVTVSEHVWTRKGPDGALLESTAITRVHCLAFLNGPVRCFLVLAPGNPVGDPGPNSLALAERRSHECVLESENPQMLWFCPPDGCYIELLRLQWPPPSPVPLLARGKAWLQGPLLWLQIHLNSMELACVHLELRVPLPSPPVGLGVSLRTGCLDLAPELAKSLKVSIGSVRYEEALGALVWSIGRLPARNTTQGSAPQSLLCVSALAQQCFSEWPAFFTLEFDLEEDLSPPSSSYSLGVESDHQPQRSLKRRCTHHCQVQLAKQMTDEAPTL